MDIKTLLPMLKRVVPGIIAQDIVGVQPMSAPVGEVFTMKTSFTKMLTYEVVEDIVRPIPADHVIVFVNVEIGNWIEQQPVHMWKFYDLDHDTQKWAVRSHYIISNQLLTWMKLRWQ